MHERDSVEGKERMVRAVEDEYDRAWSVGDLDAVMECLRPDAVLVNPRGHVAVGHEAIRLGLAAFLGGEARGSHHRSTVERAHFVGEDVAVVDGHAVIALSGSDERLEHRFTDVLVRDHDGQWRIAHVRAYHHEAAVSPPVPARTDDPQEG